MHGTRQQRASRLALLRRRVQHSGAAVVQRSAWSADVPLAMMHQARDVQHGRVHVWEFGYSVCAPLASSRSAGGWCCRVGGAVLCGAASVHLSAWSADVPPAMMRQAQAVQHGRAHVKKKMDGLKTLS